MINIFWSMPAMTNFWSPNFDIKYESTGSSDENEKPKKKKNKAKYNADEHQIAIDILEMYKSASKDDRTCSQCVSRIIREMKLAKKLVYDKNK